MKNVLKKVSLLALAVAIALPLAAADKEKKKNQKKGDSALVKKVKDAGADEETVKKVQALVKEYSAKIAEANKAIDADTRKRINEARKAAAADGKKKKDLEEAVAAAVQLTDEQKAGQKEAQELQQKLNAAVAELLTPEQREKAGLVKGKKKKDAA